MSQLGNIKLKGKIWKKEIYDLIDFDNINFYLINIPISESGMIYRIENQIFYSQKINKIFKPFQLFQILKTEKEYIILTEKTEGNLKKIPKENLAYLIYKGISLKKYNEKNKNKKKNWYKLNEGEIFKLGRVYIKVHKIKSEDNKYINNIDKTYDGLSYSLSRNESVGSILEANSQILRISKNNKFKKIQVFKRDNSIQNLILPRISLQNYTSEKNEKVLDNSSMKSNNNNNLCRICYSNLNTYENPLICPCKCSGSLAYIHYKCLKNWLHSKIENKNNETTITYNLKNYYCELCKENYPDYIKYNNRLYNLILYEPKFNHYIIIETVRDDKFKTRFFHVINFDDKKTISLGRASECELSIPELSISRNHCFIHKIGFSLYLEDNYSKFGTLVLIQNPKIKLIKGLPLKMQIGKTFISLKLQVKSSFFSCCDGEDIDFLNCYQRQNSKFLDVYKGASIKENKDNENEKSENEIEIKKIKIIKEVGKENKSSSLPMLNLDNPNIRSQVTNNTTNLIRISSNVNNNSTLFGTINIENNYQSRNRINHENSNNNNNNNNNNNDNNNDNQFNRINERNEEIIFNNNNNIIAEATNSFAS